jgi:CCR4-NOT transcriptional regulation complex NOT5 subunit
MTMHWRQQSLRILQRPVRSRSARIVPTVILSLDDEIELSDVAAMLRRYADKREAELNATWEGMEEPRGAINEGRQYVANLRDAADYHERQAQRRRHLNGHA